MPSRQVSAPGKIILSGEYAVVFGYPGIAVPSHLGVTATYTEDFRQTDLQISWPDIHPAWLEYLRAIINDCQAQDDHLMGTLSIEADVPLGKGMGSSTAVVVAVTRALLGDQSKDTAWAIEQRLNPGNSGLDFAVIWQNAPVEFRRSDEPRTIRLEHDLLRDAVLIDTGAPNEQTPELVSWMESRQADIADALATIGQCSERLIAGKDPALVLRDHHRAQVELGVVPEPVQQFISAIEAANGSAKVIGAGGRSGGAGIVLATGISSDTVSAMMPDTYSLL